MNPTSASFRLSGIAAFAFAVLTFAAPASAQWTRVADVPNTRLFSLTAKGDTLLAGADTVAYVSTNGGATWQRSAKPVAGVAAITAGLVRNGRLYIGTFGHGAFISDNLGASWTPFNQGLAGQPFESQFEMIDFVARGDSLIAGTAGVGTMVRRLSTGGPWQAFGAAFAPNQAINVNSVASNGPHLLAMAGSNGQCFFRDPGDADWTVTNLNNVGLLPGVQAYTAIWTGTGWVVSTILGPFRSSAGHEPWTLANLGLPPINWTAFATKGGRLFGAFTTTQVAFIEESEDDGATWHNVEPLPAVFVHAMAIGGTNLYAARADGLWRRPFTTVAVTDGVRPGALRFALAGAQPFRDQARLRFDLPVAENASIAVFDVAGRMASPRIEGWMTAGPHEVALDGARLTPGVYEALLTAGDAHEVVRLVHVR